MKSAGSIKVNNNNHDIKSMKRCESMDVTFDNINNSQKNSEENKSGWLKKYFSRLPSLSSISAKPEEPQQSSVDANESFTMNRNHEPIQRSKIASRWEALHEQNEA